MFSKVYPCFIIEDVSELIPANIIKIKLWLLVYCTCTAKKYSI